MKKVLILLFLLLILAGCSKSRPGGTDTPAVTPGIQTKPAEERLGESKSRSINVMVTTDIIRDLMYMLARSRTSGRVIIPPGTNPLTYKPTAEDEKDLLGAELILYNGLGLEPGLGGIFEKASQTVRTVAISDCLEKNELLRSDKYKGGYDPHFWWNPRLWEKVVKYVTGILIEVDPEYEFSYRSGYIRYGKSLSMARRYFEAWFSGLSGEDRAFVSLYPAFSYMADVYHFNTRSLLDYAGGDSMEMVNKSDEVLSFIKEKQITVLFPSFKFSRDPLEAFKTRALGDGVELKMGEELYTYSLGDPGTIEYTYLRGSYELVNRVYSSLKPDGTPEMPARQ